MHAAPLPGDPKLGPNEPDGAEPLAGLARTGTWAIAALASDVHSAGGNIVHPLAG